MTTRPHHDSHRLPRYLKNFACLGPACPDSCCAGGWAFPIDRATLERWQSVSADSLRQALRDKLRVLSQDQRPSAERVADFVQKPGHECSMLTADRWCSIHADHGEEMLPQICHSYPRQYRRAGDRLSLYATLGCPETARLALADPHALDFSDSARLAPLRPADVVARKSLGVASAAELADDGLDAIEASAALWEDTARELIVRRDLTARQAWRYFTWVVHDILASVAQDSAKSDVVEVIRIKLAGAVSRSDIAARAIAQERSCDARSPLADRLQLAQHAARTVADMPLSSPSHTVLAESLSGIDSSATGEPSARGLQQFEQAEQQWFEPFDRRHPHLLKNYLLNVLGMNNFPAVGWKDIGEVTGAIGLRLDLLRLFLVGRAQQRREQFDVADYVQVVQAQSRYLP
jgi:lysine-N-methylase